MPKCAFTLELSDEHHVQGWSQGKNNTGMFARPLRGFIETSSDGTLSLAHLGRRLSSRRSGLAIGLLKAVISGRDLSA